jgi:NAD(P)H-flavin reductase
MEVSVPGIGEGPFHALFVALYFEVMDMTIMKAGFVTEYIHKTKIGDRIGLRGRPYGKGYPLDLFKRQRCLDNGRRRRMAFPRLIVS